MKPSAAILLIAFVVLDYTVILYIQSQTQHSGGSEHRHREAQEPDLPIAEELNWTMVGAIQPGRPGNLTVEQEVKLQELWKATLKVFGVSIEDGPEPSEIAEAEEKEENGTAVTSEKKKKKKGLFSRKKTEKVDGEEKGKGKSATTEDKYGQLKEFQTALSNMPAEELRAAFWSMVKHDNPDALLLRFLRARKWDVEKALVMMISTMHWRAKEMYVEDDVMIKGEEAALKDTSSSDAAVKKEGDGFLAQLRLGKSFLHGVDKEGRPMCIVRVRLHKAGEQSEKSLERYTVHVLETARLLINPPIDTAVSIKTLSLASLTHLAVNCFRYDRFHSR